MIGTKPAPSQLRIGVLGCANIAWRRTLPSLYTEPRVSLVAIASRDIDRARTFADRFGGTPMANYSELLTRSDIDAVYVPLPPGLHEEWVCRALEAGKHVLVEKPFAIDARQATRMLALADERDRVLVENLMFVHHGQHDRVRELVTEGRIGELRGFEGAFGFPPLPADDSRYDPALGGGALLDTGVYPLRAARLLLGDELEPEGVILRQDPDSGVDIAGHALLRSSDGCVAQVSFGFEFAYRCEYSLWGSKGRIVLDRAYTPPWWHQPVVRVERAESTEEIRLPAQDQFALSLRAFAAAVLDGTAPHDGPDDVLRQAELVDQVRSRATGVLR